MTGAISELISLRSLPGLGPRRAGFWKGFQLLALSAIAFGTITGGCGKPVPNVSFESLKNPGTKISLQDLRGKVVLIDFWATWCAPCRETMPFIQSLQDKFAAKGLQIVAVSQEDRAIVDRFEKSSPYSYPVFLDTDGSVNRVFKVETIPRTILIDKNGNVVADGHPLEIKDKIESSLPKLLE